MLTGMIQIAGSDIANVDTVQAHSLGTMGYGDAFILQTANAAAYNATSSSSVRFSGNVYIYLSGIASTIAGSVVLWDELGVTTLATTSTAAGAQVVVATAATDVATEFGWYLLHGTGVIATAGDVAADGRAQTTATAGKLDDTTTANKYLNNAFFRTATTAGAAALTTGQVSFSSSNVAA